jgi:ribosome-binding factor A
MTLKQDQLASTIERALRDRFSRGFHDPRISGLITITTVKVTQDLKFADVGISVLPAEKQTLTLHGLEAAARHIRREIMDDVTSRTMPEIRFSADNSLKKQAGIMGVLDKIKHEDTAKPTWGTTTSEGDAGKDAPA